MNKIMLRWLVVGLWLLPLLVQAEEKERRLKDRIPSVSNRANVKSSRLELTLYPLTSLSLNDAFYQKFGGGLDLGYHFNEAFSLHAMGTYSLSMGTENAAFIGEGDSRIPYAGKRKILFGLDLAWSPIYGKVSVAAEWIMHFDTYLLAGLGGVLGEQQTEDNFAIGLDVGVGARFFFNRTWALRLELKDVILFNDQVTIPNLPARDDVQHQLMLNLGLSIFFLEGDRE